MTRHNAKVTLQKMTNLGFKVLTHPPYSPDLAPSDYYLFRPFQHFLNGKNFENPEAIQNEVSAYFNAKDLSWFEKGFKDLLKRWETVIDSNGKYITPCYKMKFFFGILFLIKDSSIHFEADSEYVISFYAGRTNFF